MHLKGSGGTLPENTSSKKNPVPPVGSAIVVFNVFILFYLDLFGYLLSDFFKAQ